MLLLTFPGFEHRLESIDLTWCTIWNLWDKTWIKRYEDGNLIMEAKCRDPTRSKFIVTFVAEEMSSRIRLMLALLRKFLLPRKSTSSPEDARRILGHHPETALESSLRLFDRLAGRESPPMLLPYTSIAPQEHFNAVEDLEEEAQDENLMSDRASDSTSENTGSDDESSDTEHSEMADTSDDDFNPGWDEQWDDDWEHEAFID